MFKRILASLLAGLFYASVFGTIGTLAACNTVDGMGRDLQAGGREIREEARERR